MKKDELAAWKSDIRHRAVTQACARVKVWPSAASRKGLRIRAEIRYSAPDEDEWTPHYRERAPGDDRALVLVRANDITVDAYYATLGKTEITPASPYPKVWWA